jgi:cysteine desulfurase
MAYLDHAATTPMLEEVITAMAEAMGQVGNPSSLHAAGRRARRTVEESRERLAAALDARPSEVIFTGGGTEADNLAVKGIFYSRRDEARASGVRRERVLVSSVEHHAVLDAAGWLAQHEGAEVVYLDVDRVGRVRPQTLRRALDADPDGVALISVMWANNEVGTIQPVAELAGIAAEYGVPMHSDAVQAVGSVPLSFADSGLAAMTITGHKLGGPVGSGALLLGRGVGCTPLAHGGGQERDVRSGTVDAAGVLGLSLAAERAVARCGEQARRVSGLRDALISGIGRRVPAAILNGARRDERLPGNVHMSFPGCEGDSLLMLLDAQGIECSTGSACSAGVTRASHVLLAMGLDPDVARGSLRLSLGHTSTDADVVAVLDVIAAVVERARGAGLARPVQSGARSDRVVITAGDRR